MSLFKILKGDSSRIDMRTTPFHDGYAYFTPDDGGFYIDSEDGGVQRRIRINPDFGSTSVPKTLTANGWSNGQQVLAIEGITADSNGIIGIAQNITEAQLEAATNAGLYVCAQGAGTLTVAVSGETPDCDIPVVAILIK